MQPEDPLQPPQDVQDTIQSWKDIASFLGVTVRTAQLWEEERGLPVRRNPGGKGRVFAYPAELISWREGSYPAPSPAEPPPADPTPFPRKSRWLLWTLPAAVLAAALLLWLPNRARGVPSGWRLDGQYLIVTGAEGRTLWTHRFDRIPDRNWETNPTISKPDFVDTDNDGDPELLFPLNTGGVNSPRNGALICFASNGGIRWAFQATRTVAMANGDRHRPPYGIRQFSLVPGASGSPSRILVTATHASDCPSAAVLLDHRGKSLREYWHAGHFNWLAVTDLDPGGGPEIYVGAVSNSHKSASLIVLDPESFTGAAAEAQAKYRIQGMAPPRELCRIIFNRMRVGPLVQPFNYVSTIRRHGETLIVGVAEDLQGKLNSGQMLTFGPRMVLEELTLVSMSLVDYRRLYAQGLIPSDNPELEIPALKKLLYLTPWTPAPQRTAAQPPPASD